jgi:hypothetical protein
LKFINEVLVKRGIILAATVCGVLVFGCPKFFAVEGIVNAGYGVVGQSILLLKSTWPTVLQVLRLFKEQGLLLALLLGLSAFFSLAETSITTLWPWKVSCLFPPFIDSYAYEINYHTYIQSQCKKCTLYKSRPLIHVTS